MKRHRVDRDPGRGGNELKIQERVCRQLATLVLRSGCALQEGAPCKGRTRAAIHVNCIVVLLEMFYSQSYEITVEFEAFHFRCPCT